jgi:hypothetical protein
MREARARCHGSGRCPALCQHGQREGCGPVDWRDDTALACHAGQRPETGRCQSGDGVSGNGVIGRGREGDQHGVVRGLGWAGSAGECEHAGPAS